MVLETLGFNMDGFIIQVLSDTKQRNSEFKMNFF
jgi:hypothetical protein